jgi:VWFA-related protein
VSVRRAPTLATAVAGAFAAAFAAAQEPPEPPVFGAEVDLVAVDVTVIDPLGRPVRGLSPADFILEVDGRPRRLVSLDFVDQSGEPAPGPEPTAGVSTNEGAVRGRLVVLVFDQGNIRQGYGRQAVDAADRLLDTLTPADRVGLISLGIGGPNVELTSDHKQVRDALRRVIGRARFGGVRISLVDALAYLDRQPRWEEVVRRECPETMEDFERLVCLSDIEGEASTIAHDHRAQSRISLSGLAALFTALGAVEGPKTAVLITEGLGLESTPEISDIAAKAAAANVSLYTLLLEGPRSDASRSHPESLEDIDLQRRGIDLLASYARGTVFRVAAGADAAFERLARELSGYYLLSFEPEPGDRDGRSHPIKVGLARKGLTVRSRGSLTIPRIASPRTGPDSVMAALREPFLATELRVRVATFALPDSAGQKVRMLVAAEVGKAEGEVQVGFVFSTQDGRPAASGGGRVASSSSTGAFLGTATVPNGAYVLKLAAVDGAGRRGSVEHPVKAAVSWVGGLDVSELLLGAVPKEGAGFRPDLDLSFTPGPLVAYVELHHDDGARLGKAGVAVEVSDPLGGPALLSVPASVRDEAPGRRIAQAILPLSLLPPGDYLARAALSVGDAAAGAVTRGFRIEPAAPSDAARPRGPVQGLGSVVDRFDRAAALRGEVVAHFLERVRELVPGPAPPVVETAFERARSGAPEAALDVLAESTRPDARVAFLRGLGLYARGQHAAAMGQFREALRLASDLLPAAFFLGASYAAQGEDRQAVGAWQTALVSETGSPALYALLGDALLRVGEVEQGVAILEEGARAFPSEWSLQRKLGLGLAIAGRAEEALPLLTATIDRVPDDVPVLFAMLRLFFDQLASGTVAAGAERDRLLRYGRAYIDARGPNQEIVAHWLRYLERQ